MDMQLGWRPIHGTLGVFDILMLGSDVQTGRSLDTSIIISLFTWGRARADDVLPDPQSPRYGFWADSYSDIEGDKSGSRLWLLKRAKQTPETLAFAKEACQEALAWLYEDNVANRVDIVVSYHPTLIGRMGIEVFVYRPTGLEVYRYDYAWREVETTWPGDTDLEKDIIVTLLLTDADTALVTEDGYQIALE